MFLKHSTGPLSIHKIHKEDLQNFQNRLMNFGKGNALYQISSNNWKAYTPDENGGIPESDNGPIEKLFRKGKPYEKSTGISPWKTTKGILHWWDEKRGMPVSSPLFLTDGTLQRLKGPVIRYQFLNAGEPFLNPLLKYYFEDFYGISFKNLDTPDLNSFLKCLENAIEDLHFTEHEDIAPLTWKLKKTEGLGAFNTGSYAFLHDYKEFLEEGVVTVHFHSGAEESQNIPAFIQRPDPSQLRALKSVASGKSMMITGPPGTGKSSLIGNIIADAVLNEKKVLFVSEKKTALDVVYEMMQKKGLDSLCSYYHHKQSPTKWVQKLNEAFEKMLGFKRFSNQPDFYQLQQKAAQQGDFFRQFSSVIEEKVGNTDKSVGEVLVMLENTADKIDTDKTRDLQTFHPHVGEISAFLKEIKQLETFVKVTQIKSDVILEIKNSFFMEQDDIGASLKKMTTHLQSDLIQIQKALSHLEELPSLKLFKELSLVVTQIKNHFTAYQKIFSTQKEQERFLKWGHELLAIENSLAEYRKTLGIPDEELPSPSEIHDIKEQLQQPTKWYQFIFKKKNLKPIPAIQNLESLKAKIDFLDRLMVYQEKKLHLSEKKARFHTKYELNISAAELDMMLSGVERMNRYHKAVQWLVNAPDASLVSEQILNIENAIERTYRAVLYLWGSKVLDQPLNQLEDKLKQATNLIPLFEQSAPIIKGFPKHLKSILKVLVPFHSAHLLEIHLWFAALENHLKYRPVFSGTPEKEWTQKKELFRKTIQQYEVASNLQMIENQVEKTRRYLELTDQYAKETKTDQKELRKILQKGKRILFHEFSKSMRHKSPFELMQTEAKEWIQNLQPLWIMNTLSVSESLPLKKEMFDLVIFDESSQIPIEHAIPAIFRSKQVVVVGDEQQMPPLKFFSSSITDDDKEISLMQYFRSVFYQETLQWHYRSQAPELIAFSNTYFYNNHLIPLPRIQLDQKAVSSTFVEGGRFIDRKNEAEAAAVCELIRKHSSTDESVAIVCFSSEQAQLMEKKIPEHPQLTIMSLEQVQGEEFDHVIISLAYGKNEEEQFRYYLGPLNRSDGKKRLNVLMSRARKSMHLFHSILPEDFNKKYDNPGVEMLYRMLCFFINQKENTNHKEAENIQNHPSPLGTIKINGQKIFWEDRFGHHALVKEDPLNETFIEYLFEVLKTPLEVKGLKRTWEQLSRPNKN